MKVYVAFKYPTNGEPLDLEPAECGSLDREDLVEFCRREMIERVPSGFGQKLVPDGSTYEIFEIEIPGIMEVPGHVTKK